MLLAPSPGVGNGHLNSSSAHTSLQSWPIPEFQCTDFCGKESVWPCLGQVATTGPISRAGHCV